MIPAAREPNFDNLLKVLQRKEPERPTLFEFYLDNEISEKLTGQKAKSAWDCSWNYEMIIPAMITRRCMRPISGFPLCGSRAERYP